MSKNKIIGVKGFDRNMQCQGFQYKQNEVYAMESKPRLCAEGFHYCNTIEDVFKFYRNDGKNKFHYVEILGDIDAGKEKSCTNKIKILEPFDLKKEKLPISTLARFSETGFVIGGSVALRIYGYNIKRSITEVDLIVDSNTWDNVKDEVYEHVFRNMKEVNRFSGMDSVKCYVGLMGEKYDIIQQENVCHVVRTVDGYEIKVQDENEIWHHKLKYALNGSTKHADDIRLNGIDFQVKPKAMRVPSFIKNGLPF